MLWFHCSLLQSVLCDLELARTRPFRDAVDHDMGHWHSYMQKLVIIAPVESYLLFTFLFS